MPFPSWMPFPVPTLDALPILDAIPILDALFVLDALPITNQQCQNDEGMNLSITDQLCLTNFSRKKW